MREFLKRIVAAKEKRANELREQIKKSEDVNEVRSLGETLQAVLDELTEAKAKLAESEEGGNGDNGEGDGAQRSAKPNVGFNPVASYSARNTGADHNMEKRLAFANFVTRGVMTEEMRATTNTTNTAAAIPENLIGRIIENIEAVGMIYNLVTRTSYPVGQSIPVDSAKPTASWVAEGAGSTAQAKGTLGSIVFGAFKLRCEIRMTQEVTVQTIAQFEALFIKQVSEAMVKAIESKIVSDDAGAANPTGILYNAADNDAEVSVTVLDYETLCNAEAELPQQYENGAKWFMSKKTFMAFVAMTDDAGQPVARVNYGIGGKPERTLLGRDVVLTGEYLTDFASATSGACFAFLFAPTDYVLNTSYDLGIQKKQDWETEDHCVKAVMSVDGKVIDRHSLVKLVKG